MFLLHTTTEATEGAGRMYEAPCEYGIGELIKNCCKQVRVPLGYIRYLEAHATGASVGDLIGKCNEIIAGREKEDAYHSQAYIPTYTHIQSSRLLPRSFVIHMIANPILCELLQSRATLGE